MKRIEITAAKIAVVFPEGKLPPIDPADPTFDLVMGPLVVRGKVNAKAARKLAVHAGGAVLQGRLVAAGGKFELVDAGFSWIDPKPEPAAAPPEVAPS